MTDRHDRAAHVNTGQTDAKPSDPNAVNYVHPAYEKAHGSGACARHGNNAIPDRTGEVTTNEFPDLSVAKRAFDKAGVDYVGKDDGALEKTKCTHTEYEGKCRCGTKLHMRYDEGTDALIPSPFRCGWRIGPGRCTTHCKPSSGWNAIRGTER